MKVIGVDPDSEKHGIAIYEEGELTGLYNWQLLKIQDFITRSKDNDFGPLMFSIENVLAQNFLYTRHKKQSKLVEQSIIRSVGRCQQAQQELMRLLDWHEVPYVLHKPQKGNFATNKAQFEKLTGWSSRSNEDQRSAAYFGLLEAGRH